MKIKFDFVTNSSSSCFVVVFPEKITTIEQVSKFIPAESKAEQVFKDAMDSKQKKYKMNTKRAANIIKEALDYGFIGDITGEGYLDTQEFAEAQGVEGRKGIYTNPRWQDAFYKTERIRSEIAAEKYAKKFVTENPEGILYLFDYGDDDGEFFSEMEHGGTFNNLPHIAISHH